MNFKLNKKKVIIILVLSLVIMIAGDYFLSRYACVYTKPLCSMDNYFKGTCPSIGNPCSMWGINSGLSFIFLFIPALMIIYLIWSLLEKR